MPIPTIPAKEITFFGESYWVKTLNAHEMDAALNAAKVRTHEATANYSEMPKGSLYDAQYQAFASMTPEEQTQSVIASAYFEWWGDARNRYPDPYPPEPADKPGDHDELQAQHEKEAEEAKQKQREFIEGREKEATARILAFSETDRLKLCMRSYRALLEQNIEYKYQNAEILARAFRLGYDHSRSAFTVEEYLDFTEEAKTEILKAYRSLDSVQVNEIPT